MALSDDRLEDNNFTKRVFSELKSRLHARFVQYEVFTFASKLATINIMLTNTSVTVRLPYAIETTNDEDVFRLFYRSNEIEGSLQSLISYIISSMRREESKMSKFKQAN